MKIFHTLLALSLMATCSTAEAVPSTFEPVIGGAVLCRDQIEPPYFQNYLTSHFKSPYKTEGGAYWHKTEGIQLFGVEVEEIFVSTGADKVDFLGVVLNAQVGEVRQKLASNPGITYFPDPSEKILRSASGSHLLEFKRTKSKLFCVKYRVGR